eukprot:TRINITY_DN5288_c0_g1_i1.p1 TRINITY_DN5288_c0_g1~~TRINITY_DN5288_c0_g1_i1.p1  ORF type:complete len:427 (+),score=102.20 TRINITY_DN5288_c0_g1_i1:1494-2774(+)
MGSFKMEGIIEYLTSSQAQRLRNLYVFKVVPMLNPEGVLCGNFRCSITGVDLNRRWDAPDEFLHPQIFYLKNFMKMLGSGKQEILVFCDLHGHNRKNNSFIYGCNKAANGGFCSWTWVRLLPRILATKTAMFSYNDCRFRVENWKQRTARVVAWKELGITNSFTLESSFFGYRRGDAIVQFETRDYYELGRMVLVALEEYYLVLKRLEKELIDTNGWLKPYRLFEVTGVLAADELAKEIAAKKKGEKAKKRTEEMNELKDRQDKAEVAKKTEKKRKPLSGKPRNAKQRLVKTNGKNNEDGNMNLFNDYDNEKEEIKANEQVASKEKHFTKLIAHPKSVPLSTLCKSSNDNSETSEGEDVEGMRNDWRRYFARSELESAYNQINAGIDPNDQIDEESSEYESDSNPSEDNLEAAELFRVNPVTLRCT